MEIQTMPHNTLIFVFEQESNFRMPRINNKTSDSDLLRFGRAINMLQRGHAHTFIREVRTNLKGE